MKENNKESFDPRVNRMEHIPDDQPHKEGDLFQWQNYEVFQQMKRGEQHVHVGSLHAPNPEMAIVLAKEQYGRREQCANLWVVKTLDVYVTSYDDADMFQHAFDKSYRESDGYRVKDTIEKFKTELDKYLLESKISRGELTFNDDTETEQEKTKILDPSNSNANCKVVVLPPGKDSKNRRILIRN